VCETSKLCHALLLKWTVKLLGEDIAAINELRSLTMFPEEASSDIDDGTGKYSPLSPHFLVSD
jgi:hypothetical protein